MALQDAGAAGDRRERNAETGLAALNQAARRLGEIAGRRPKGRTRDLVALLLAHGARAWRASQPRATVRVQVETGGRAAIRLAIG